VLSDSEIERIAREEKFVQRSSKITAKQFLKMLLFDHLQFNQPSLGQHVFGMFDDTGRHVSREGLNKRFNAEAVSFIRKIFESFLAASIDYGGIETELQKKFSAVRIQDSTEFKLADSLAKDFPGYSESNALACAAIQFEYDIIGKKISCLSLGSAKESDKAFADNHMGNITLRQLLLRDLGYYGIKSYSQIESRGAFYISRLKPKVVIYRKKGDGYEAVSWAEIGAGIERGGGGYFDQVVYIGAEEKKEVRLMAWVLPDAAQRRRLKRKANRKGTVSADDMVWSTLNVFITNIGQEDLTVKEAYQLYRIRWQIELVFKTWKSILKIHLLRKMKPDRVKCYLYSMFVWIVLCWDITSVFEPVVWGHTKQLVSLYKCYGLLKNQAHVLKGILFNRRERLKEWLMKMLEAFAGFGLKETKKGGEPVKISLKYKEKTN
jgi:hypothetical protein